MYNSLACLSLLDSFKYWTLETQILPSFIGKELGQCIIAIQSPHWASDQSLAAALSFMMWLDKGEQAYLIRSRKKRLSTGLCCVTCPILPKSESKTQLRAFIKVLYICQNYCFWDVLFFPRVVVLESRPTDNPTANSNLYILAGHENSYWEATR